MTHKEFISYFEEDLFIPDLQSSDKQSAIAELVDHLVAKKRVKNGNIVLEALRKRESLGSTGIGKHLAVPHGRTTVTTNLTVLFARSVEGVPWESLDGKPVHFIVLVLGPHQDKDNHYLPLLGKVVEFARDANTRKRLLKSDTHAALVDVLSGGKG
jgi:PTS system nitrogen regulatory IIA component